MKLTRRKFLHTLGGAVALAAAPAILPGCSAGLAIYRGQLRDEIITIPQAEASALAAPNGVMLVRAQNFPVTIVVRRLEDNRLAAISTICTHSGCEVRILPDAFQCPCHGSEYDVTGGVIEGPAAQPLQNFSITEDAGTITIKVRS